MRMARNFSQDKIAQLAGISQAAYQRIESDNFKRIDIEVLERLAKVLGVEPKDIADPSTELDHLPIHLQQFVKDPKNINWLQYIFAISQAPPGMLGIPTLPKDKE